jgi:hypothetical protein
MGDWLAFLGLIPAGVAATLLVAASRALGVAPDWESAALAASGTLVVYNIDRLRDLAADRATSPLRTAFIERHRSPVLLLTAAAAVSSGVLGLRASREVLLICGGVLAVGLLHRRLKHLDAWKGVYVTAGWVAVTAGIPAVTAVDPVSIAWVLVVYATAIGSNVLATRLRQGLATNMLLAARTIAVIGTLAALLGPDAVRPLACVTGFEALALAAFRPGERYGFFVVDGALLVGGLAALRLAAT